MFIINNLSIDGREKSKYKIQEIISDENEFKKEMRDNLLENELKDNCLEINEDNSKSN
jgi:hypothetical protein